VVVVVRLGGVILGCYTGSGSGIEAAPHDGSDGAHRRQAPRARPRGRDGGEGSDLDDHGGR
jgi:hypothetical protein